MASHGQTPRGPIPFQATPEKTRPCNFKNALRKQTGRDGRKLSTQRAGSEEDQIGPKKLKAKNPPKWSPSPKLTGGTGWVQTPRAPEGPGQAKGLSRKPIRLFVLITHSQTPGADRRHLTFGVRLAAPGGGGVSFPPFSTIESTTPSSWAGPPAWRLSTPPANPWRQSPAQQGAKAHRQ